ncbi:MAG: hypothetical protein AAF497_14630, partial [Planctomycetota bacterium]
MTHQWIGTSDDGFTPANPDAGNSNMILVLENQYDEGNFGGDGNLTKETHPVDATAGNDRVVTYAYDFRNRLDETISNDGTSDFISKNTYDNLNRVTEVTRYHTAVDPSNRVGLVKYDWDNQNRIFKRETFGVDGLSSGNAVAAENWFDPNGNTIKRTQPGNEAAVKIVYDGLNRAIKNYLIVNSGGSSDDNDPTNDTVIEQGATTFDTAGNVILSTNWARFHDATGTGALNGPNDAQPKARRSFAANWPDGIGRIQTSANLGTHGGEDFSRPGVAPKRSDAVLVTTRIFGPTGEEIGSIDPAGTQTRWKLDALNRQIEVIQNFIEYEKNENEEQSLKKSEMVDENRISRYQYHADGGLSRLTLVNEVTGDQVTQWIYGTTPSDSAIATSYLLRAKIYPESDNSAAPLGDGPDGVYERIEYQYNRQGDITQMKDPNETIHQYDYDGLGRQTADRVTAFAVHIDQTVKRIATTFDNRGQTAKVTSYDAVSAGNVVNEAAFTYDNFGQLTADKQSHSGAVNGSTPQVGYAYDDGSNGNTARRTSITYPNGRKLDINYGVSGSDNNLLSRVASIQINGETSAAAGYTYLGISEFVRVEYPQPGAELTYIKAISAPVGDAGDPYIGLDRFDRTVDMLWQKTGDQTALDHIQYGYNRASNRTWRKNLVAPSGQDEAYKYDGLYQLKEFSRGNLNLNQTLIGGIPASVESFEYDPTGNWLGYERKTEGVVDLDQTRVNNKDNQITQFDGSSEGVDHDRAGNATLMPHDASGSWTKCYTLSWDAWNRLVKVESGAILIASYEYDGLFRRTIK